MIENIYLIHPLNNAVSYKSYFRFNNFGVRLMSLGLIMKPVFIVATKKQFSILEYKKNSQTSIVNINRDRITIIRYYHPFIMLNVSLLKDNMLYIVYHISSLYLIHRCKYYSLPTTYSASKKDRIMLFILTWSLNDI